MLERNILDDNLTLSAYVLRQRLEGARTDDRPRAGFGP